VRKAGDKAGPYRVANVCHDDRDCFGGLLSSLSCRSSLGKDDVYFELHQLGRKARKSFFHTVSGSPLKTNRLSFNIIEFAQALPESLYAGLNG